MTITCVRVVHHFLCSVCVVRTNLYVPVCVCEFLYFYGVTGVSVSRVHVCVTSAGPLNRVKRRNGVSTVYVQRLDSCHPGLDENPSSISGQ